MRIQAEYKAKITNLFGVFGLGVALPLSGLQFFELTRHLQSNIKWFVTATSECEINRARQLS